MPSSWSPSEAQRARLARFEPWFHEYLQRAIAEKRLDDELRCSEDDIANAPFLAALREQFGADLEPWLADFLMFPAAHQRIPNTRASADRHYTFARLASRCLDLGLTPWRAEYFVDLAMQRLRFQLEHPLDDLECAEPAWLERERERIQKTIPAAVAHVFLRELARCNRRHRNPFLSPDPQELVARILETEPGMPVLDTLLAMLEGQHGVMVDPSQPPPELVEDAECESAMSSAMYLRITDYAADLAAGFARLGQLDPSRLQRLFAVESPLSSGLLLQCLNQEEPVTHFRPEALEFIYGLSQRPLDEALKALDKFAEDASVAYSDEPKLVGGRFLLAGARLIQLLGRAVPQLDQIKDDQDRRPARVLKLLCHVRPTDTNDREQLLTELCKLEPAILQQLLQHCLAQAEPVLCALGWGKAAPLYAWLFERERADPNEPFDRLTLADLMLRAGDQAQSLLTWMKTSKQLKLGLRRIEAIQGVPDKKLEGMLERLSQDHIRLWGLYPIIDADDMRRRFDFFKRAGKLAAKQFGQERSANVRDAAATGLIHLASTAGFSDVTELEWALDAGTQSAQDWSWSGDGYEVNLHLQRFQPELNVFKAGKLLKSLPPALKKDNRLLPLLSQFDQLKDQSKRYRVAMENLMVSARALPPSQLAELAQLPMAQQLLGALYVRTAEGKIGILDASLNRMQVLNPDGTLQSELEPVLAPLEIAHALTLLQEGMLIACQLHSVAANLVQPFKQAFRECYVLTPAERDAGDASQRFAGRRVKTSVLGAILNGRGWRIQGSDSDFVARRRIVGDLFVSLALPEVYQFLTQEEHTILGEITFERGDQRVPLESVPALGFSEAMRDLDLVITAGAADSDEDSLEVQRARVALVSTLIPTLGLKQVSVEGHHALIRGKRATYRLHLGTAVVHIMPAGYLCIVPAAAASKKSIALPFVDEDQRTSEVLSKLLLLSADDKITDASILQQIAGQAGS